MDECFLDPKISHEYLDVVHNCHEDANCTNSKGSFYCTCNTGYSGDGVVCAGNFVARCYELSSNINDNLHLTQCCFADLNECNPSGLSGAYKHLAHICHADGNCTNTKGSYSCDCLEGYQGNGVVCQGNVKCLNDPVPSGSSF